MAFRAPNPPSNSKKPESNLEERGVTHPNLLEALFQIKQQILDSRAASVKEKLKENGRRLTVFNSELLESANSRKDCSVNEKESNNLLSVRKKNALCRLNGSDTGVGEKESTSLNSQEELSASTIIFGNSSGGKCAVRTAQLPHIEKIPRYTTWIFLDRNQRMADDQSVLGRRQIYYDQKGSETIICSDSDAEIMEPDDEKHHFSDGEDQLLWTALQERGSSPEVLNILRQFIDASTSEMEERYDILRKMQSSHATCPEPLAEIQAVNIFLEKTLSGALDSFDNLFCRRCLVFDCRPHGCSQNLILPSEKLPFTIDSEDLGKPCGKECYLQVSPQVLVHGPRTSKSSCSSKQESEEQHASCLKRADDALHKTKDLYPGGMTSAIKLLVDISMPTSLENKGKRKTLEQEDSLKNSTRIIAGLSLGSDKKQKSVLNDNVAINAENQNSLDIDSLNNTENWDSGSNMESTQSSGMIGTSPGLGDINKDNNILKVEGHEFFSNLESSQSNSATCFSLGHRDNKEARVLETEGRNLTEPLLSQSFKAWSPLEKELYLKGVEMFGKNSCLIARNLLSGLKTCVEIAEYMFNDGINRSFQGKLCSENDSTDFNYMDQETPARARILRRRGRARKLKYTWKSSGHPSIRKRIADGKERCKQYVPCECQQMCTKQCPCLENANCCEKYCGCSKSCKNRFRGCHCAKSQCRSRQCPCFAAGRECDPDVCRNCWVSCGGDGMLGSPPARGDGYQCGNMKLLLKQQQRILLGRSDVAGWGAFLKNPVNKNDYLGEYTGELISHKEADKRGKIYDRANSSFLFDLNDEFVLDACRKGDKLKFANHSSNPNCYAKIMLVAGDHRVGIFAKEHIEASEELFYDYRYGPDQAPTWARKPEGSKKDDPSASQSRRAHKAA